MGATKASIVFILIKVLASTQAVVSRKKYYETILYYFTIESTYVKTKTQKLYGERLENKVHNYV